MIKIIYFLEDSMQKDFILSLVNRVAREESVEIINDVKYASRGSESKKQFWKFVRYLKKSGLQDFDLLIVAIDGNCKGHMEREKEIIKGIKDIDDKLICCIPDPHIERWYLLDLHALKTAVATELEVQQPPMKCEKDYYKKILGNELKKVSSLLGGAEYAEKVVENLNFQILEENDKGFKRFIDGLRRHFRILKRN